MKATNEHTITDTFLCLYNENEFHLYIEQILKNFKKKLDKNIFDDERAAGQLQEVIRKYLKLADNKKLYYSIYKTRSNLEQYNSIVNKAERLEIAKLLIDSAKRENFETL